MEKTIKSLLAAVCCMLLCIAAGCFSGQAEYFEELTENERLELLRNARGLAMRSQAVPPHLREVFQEMAPHERIVYSGDKAGKASFRWEIYENARGKRITQQDVNPYWIMVYATGDLLDPEWKLSFANKNTVPAAPPAGRQAAPERRQRQRVRGRF